LFWQHWNYPSRTRHFVLKHGKLGVREGWFTHFNLKVFTEARLWILKRISNFGSAKNSQKEWSYHIDVGVCEILIVCGHFCLPASSSTTTLLLTTNTLGYGHEYCLVC